MSRAINYATATPEQVATDLGATLARLRLSRNLPQDELALRAGITERTLRNIEKGKGGNLNTLIRLMQALGLEHHLANMLPDPGIQPVDQVVLRGRSRQRAGSPAPGKQAPWAWDESETP